MQNKIKKSDKKKREEMISLYLEEMDKLVDKYKNDPNEIDLDEEKLVRLNKAIDRSWRGLKKKWQIEDGMVYKIMGEAKIKKDKKGMRHLIVKSETTGRDVLDLVAKSDS